MTIDGKSITGSGSGSGIKAYGTAANPITNLTIRNCTIKGFNIGIDARYVKNLTIENCTIDDSGYAGIMVVSGIGGRIADNLIRKVAYYTPTNTSAENNAYGIALTRIATSNFTTDPRTTGLRRRWEHDRGCARTGTASTRTRARTSRSATTSPDVVPRPLFITTDAIGTKPTNIVATGNRFEQALQVSGGTNVTAITIVNLAARPDHQQRRRRCLRHPVRATTTSGWTRRGRQGSPSPG